jgi:hypothetical protein
MMNKLEIVWVPGAELQEAPWRANYILKPDVELLKRSLSQHGWIQPIVVQRSTNTIIDGYHRWEIASNIQPLMKAYSGCVPVVYHDMDAIDAMIMHIQLNRARGSLFAKDLSYLVRSIIKSRKYTEKDVRTLLRMGIEEFDLMTEGNLIKVKKYDQHQYSSAWVPVEAPKGIVHQPIIERPPNADR